jgi:hypothetical protein
MANTNLIGRRVYVVKRDGYGKPGILREMTDNFIVLDLGNGKEEVISFVAIDTIKENGVVK